MISATVIASLFSELNIYTWPILIQSLWEMLKYIKGKDIYFKSRSSPQIGVFGPSERNGLLFEKNK